MTLKLALETPQRDDSRSAEPGQGSSSLPTRPAEAVQARGSQLAPGQMSEPKAGAHSFREEARTRSSERKSVRVMESLGPSAGTFPFSKLVRASFRLSSVFCISAVCRAGLFPCQARMHRQ